jgi:hypothetical protein
VRVQDLDDLCEIDEGPGETIDLVDDDGVDLPRLDVCEESRQRGALQRAARVAAVFVAGPDELPAQLKPCSRPSSDDFRV